MANNFCVKGTSHMLRLGLGCRTTSFMIVPLPPLLTSYLAFMPLKDHQNWNGPQGRAETALSAAPYLSSAFVPYPARSASVLIPLPHSSIVLNAMRITLTTMRTTAPSERSAAGALPLTMPITTAAPLTTNAPLPGALSSPGTHV